MPTRMTWRPGREGATLYAYPETRQAPQSDLDRIDRCVCAHIEPCGCRAKPMATAEGVTAVGAASGGAPNDGFLRRSPSRPPPPTRLDETVGSPDRASHEPHPQRQSQSIVHAVAADRGLTRAGSARRSAAAADRR